MGKSKVVSLVAWEKGTPDQYGNVKFNITFEDGVTGVYNGKPAKPFFTVGSVCDYAVENKTWSNGKEYVKVTPPPKDGNIPNRAVLSNDDIPFECLVLSVNYIKEMHKQIEKDDIYTISNHFKAWVIKDNTNTQLKLRCLKLAINCIKIDMKLDVIESTANLLSLADDFTKFLSN